jgi:hypothetical protein
VPGKSNAFAGTTNATLWKTLCGNFLPGGPCCPQRGLTPVGTPASTSQISRHCSLQGGPSCPQRGLTPVGTPASTFQISRQLQSSRWTVLSPARSDAGRDTGVHLFDLACSCRCC